MAEGGEKRNLKATVNFTTQLSVAEELNPSFAAGKMRICYHGKNRNGFDIPKQVIEDAIPSMFNCPIVAHYYRKTDSIGAHDRELIVKDGELKLVAATQPVGVVPTNNIYYWEKVEESDGTEHEYLVMPIILWKRQEAFEHIAEAGEIAESMECYFDEKHDDENGVPVVDKMTMSAFCLLESAKPCFESAEIELSDDSVKADFSLMANEWKELCGAETFTLNSIKEGGGKVEDETKIIEGEEPAQEIIPDPEPEPEDNPEPEHIEDNAGEQAPEPVGDPELVDHAIKEPEHCAAFATYEKRREALSCALPHVYEKDDDGKCKLEVYYWLEDFDENFAYVRQTTYTYEEAQDYACKRKEGRFAYTYDVETNSATFNGDMEDMVVTWLTIEENAQLEKKREQEAKLAKWYDEYKADKIKKCEKQFADLKDVEGFSEAIKSAKAGTIEVDELQEKLFALKGKHMFALETETSAVQHNVVPVDGSSIYNVNSNNRYGGIIATYSK